MLAATDTRVPTQDAYDAACRALWRHRERAEGLESALREILEAREAGDVNVLRKAIDKAATRFGLIGPTIASLNTLRPAAPDAVGEDAVFVTDWTLAWAEGWARNIGWEPVNRSRRSWLTPRGRTVYLRFVPSDLDSLRGISGKAAFLGSEYSWNRWGPILRSQFTFVSHDEL